ncbi:nuclear localization sequence-binding -like [Paramuricea clavata]|uniref:Nuclear localization sequence-binding -like n=1 Tax=Paramuricea clavata TaxID=317549 RepID=A0A6S7HDE0_PARCT|nr:nuclear localization sequence-binding -like [Paramuricea clavata]
MDRESIKKESQIYSANSDSVNLTKYQKSINDAAFQLCLENPSLVKTKGKLLDLARKKVDSDGYTYVKKRSRSTRFGAESGRKENKGGKRQKLTDGLRQKRIAELCEDIETVDKVISCLESERAKLVNMQKYPQAAQILQQMGEKRKEKRQLSDQLTTIRAKEAKSKSYHKNKQSSCTKSKCVSDVKSDNQRSVEAFFAKSRNIESRNTDACVFELDLGSRIDPKVVVAENKECHNYSGSEPTFSTKDSEDMVDGSENCVPSTDTDPKDSEVSNVSLVGLVSSYLEGNEEMARNPGISDQNNVKSSTPSPKSAIITFNKSDAEEDSAFEENISDNETSSRKVVFLCH